MLKIRQYVRPETLEEAYELCLKKKKQDHRRYAVAQNAGSQRQHCH